MLILTVLCLAVSVAITAGLRDGGGNHPSKESHAKLADELTEYLKNNLLN